MRTHATLALLSLVTFLTTGFKFGTSCTESKGLVGRGGLGVVVLRRCAEPRQNPLHHEVTVLPLVARGEEEVPKPPRAKEDIMRELGFKILEQPGSQGPSSSQRLPIQSPHPHEHVSSQTPLQTQGLPSSKKRSGSRERSGSQRPAKNTRFGGLSTIEQQAYELTGLKGTDIPDESREAIMFHTVTPDPTRYEAVKNVKTGDRSYFRRITDTRYTRKSVSYKFNAFRYTNPLQSIAVSTGNEEYYEGVRPGKYEERKTTSVSGFNSFAEWYKITPKEKKQLLPDTQPWTYEQLRRNLVLQNEAFKNHKAGQPDSAYARLDQEMRAMCNTVQCKIQPPRGFYNARHPAHVAQRYRYPNTLL